ncbi:MAG: hypothetical protein HRU36_03280 [Rickettsiales bacterium]|nr:hypothetical protein [Rickettsiales bacterium]
MATIKLKDIDRAITHLTFKSDYFIKQNYKNVHHDYVSEVVTDLIFIQSIMKNLNLSEIPILDIDNNDGVLTHNKYWRS